MHSFDEWQMDVRGRWGAKEDIFRIEGRAAVIAMRHCARTQAHSGHRVLMLVDNLGAVLSLEKGRCSSRGGTKHAESV